MNDKDEKIEELTGRIIALRSALEYVLLPPYRREELHPQFVDFEELARKNNAHWGTIDEFRELRKKTEV